MLGNVQECSVTYHEAPQGRSRRRLVQQGCSTAIKHQIKIISYKQVNKVSRLALGEAPGLTLTQNPWLSKVCMKQLASSDHI